mmetsp:Transcript_26007/g.77116  ORF Transcript_26007/g.77116 Transcript_26007/m.77116 type:complete len:83 (-) Transcript_26007:1493-1741(-)
MRIAGKKLPVRMLDASNKHAALLHVWGCWCDRHTPAMDRRKAQDGGCDEGGQACARTHQWLIVSVCDMLIQHLGGNFWAACT